jgi:hypothetical protein
MKQPIFICKHGHRELTMPRASMTLKEAKSWFKYTNRPGCKRALQVIQKAPTPVISVYTQAPLWKGKENHATR